MYLDKKMLIGFGACFVLLLGLQVVEIWRASDAIDAAEEAGRKAEAGAEACAEPSRTLTAAAVAGTLVPVRTDLDRVRNEVLALKDAVAALRREPAADPDAADLARFLRFSGAYRELLLETIARRNRVELGPIRNAVDRMFENAGGRPKGWFWGPENPTGR